MIVPVACLTLVSFGSPTPQERIFVVLSQESTPSKKGKPGAELHVVTQQALNLSTSRICASLNPALLDDDDASLPPARFSSLVLCVQCPTLCVCNDQ